MEVLLTSRPYREDELLEEMRDFGDFRPTDFRGVFLGEVDDLVGFLECLEERPLLALSRVVPIERTFSFTVENALEAFCKEAKEIVDRIGKGESFGVKVERRGLKEELSSQDIAREVGTFLFNLIQERNGQEPTVDLENPDRLVLFETLRRWCGVGVISKEMRKRYSYLVIP